MRMGGSLLPSHDATVLAPVTISKWVFTIEPSEVLQTYVLKVDGCALAMHPNGYSLKELVSRINAAISCHQAKSKTVALNRVIAQWDYILACGGLTKSIVALNYYLGV